MPEPVVESAPHRRKVLMIAPTSFFSDYGGHIRILEETLALQSVGNDITIVTYYKGRDLPGIDIRRTAPLPYHTDYEVGSSRHKLAFDVYLAVKVWQVVWRERPDLIHAHMHEGALLGSVVAWVFQLPLVFDFQGSLSGEMIDHHFLRPGGLRHRLVRWVERWIDHRPAAILTSSAQARAGLVEEFGVPPERVHPLPDCVDVARFDPNLFTAVQKLSLRQELNIPPDRPIVAYLGLLTDYQGIPDLLRAAQHLKQTDRPLHFLIMGFPNVSNYQTMAEQLGVTDVVTLPGKIPYDHAPFWLSLGDVAVSAKVSATEGSGKLLNYMALGLPVVAYDTAVHREYLGEHGVFVPPHDAIGLAEAVWALVQDHGRGQTLSHALRQRAQQQFSWTNAAQQIDTLYAQLLNTPQHKP
jgi:glycosyltransferase involved in cell wall biosynthesis